MNFKKIYFGSIPCIHGHIDPNETTLKCGSNPSVFAVHSYYGSTSVPKWLQKQTQSINFLEEHVPRPS